MTRLTRRKALSLAIAAAGLLAAGPARADLSPRRIPNRLFVTLAAPRPVTLPHGATLELALYEGALADAPRQDASRRVVAIGRRRLPLSLGLKLDRPKVLALKRPAVTASIRDASGTLLYVADTNTPYDGGRAVRLMLAPVPR